MFEISVTRKFEASHALTRGDSAAEETHPHEWRCEVTLLAETLDEIGVGADFRDVDSALDRALEDLGGGDLNSAPPLSGVSPSAENVARYLFRRLAKALGGSVARVRVWEDELHSAAYYETSPSFIRRG